MERTPDRKVPFDSDDRVDSIFDWLRVNSKLTAIAAAAVVAFALVGWLYMRAQAGKELRAEQALRRAQQSVVAGNPALAQTDLQKLVRDYGGTSSAAQGAMLLAQLHLEKGEWQPAIDVLEKSEPGRDEFEAPVQAMLGDAYSQLGKPTEAARHYRRAAELTRYEGERDGYLADAARHLTVAGDTSAARQIWQDLAVKQQSELAAEARLRLGELAARPASKS